MDCSLLPDVAAASAGVGFTGMLATLSDLAAAAAPLAQETGGEDQGITGQQWFAVVAALATLIVPFILGRYVAKAVKMPNYATRFGFVLLAVLASGVVLSTRLPGLGVDLRGGTILVYEIDPTVRGGEGDGQRIRSEDFVEPLTRRINPSGTQEIVIRPYGESQIEIIVPEVDQREVDRIKQLVEEAGILRFAILANQADHQAVIDRAIDQAESPQAGERTERIVGNPSEDLLYGRWVEVGRETAEVDERQPLRVNVSNAVVRNPRTGEILEIPFELRGENAEIKIAQWVDRQGMPGLEVLMVVNPALDITGGDLAFAASTFDQRGQPAVSFNMTDQGAPKFRALTTNNAPVGTRQRQLGIVLDDVLLSAPSINEPISREGRITGNFTREEVDRLVQILKAGRLPAALTPQPIAENQIDATLGADTIRKGVWAIVTSLVLVLIFILVYYRYVGVIACLALILNLAMILGTMVLINQPLTLPGLAGLVLTVGMSVDANVLIFERIREELKKGAKHRMAIRNGFARATTTIVDANLTTLITAIVLYAIGTDQIRGFAVTLILGILYSMFTAIYMSHTLFDLAERHRFLSLNMSDLVNLIRGSLAGGEPFDFISKGKFSLVLSALLVAVGIAALFVRGQSIFDIDFAGGSSVQFRLDQPTETDTVRDIVNAALAGLATEGQESIQSTIAGVSMEGIPEGTVYKVDSSVDDVDKLKQAVQSGFATQGTAGLVTYTVIIGTGEQSGSSEEPAAGDSDGQTPAVEDAAAADPLPGRNGVRLTALQGEAADQTAEAAADGTDSDGTGPAANQTADGGQTPAAGDQTRANGETEADETKIPAGEDPVSQPAGPTTVRTIELGIEGEGEGGGATINTDTLIASLEEAAEAVNVSLNVRGIVMRPIGPEDETDQWAPDSSLPFAKWRVELPLAADQADRVLSHLKESLGSEAVWISSSSVGARVAGDMIGRALGALFASLLCIVGYIWFRFQRVFYGFAAVVALLHDILITLGAIALSYWLADALGFLLIDQFKISLTVVAALLTIIGYSLNDTIVVFDRIRETKGKAPRLTGEMVNHSINQTLSRTLLTSVTTMIVVLLLYAFGGAGIHAFAFALVIGVLVGTYSSMFVASPILLWLLDRKEKAPA